MEAKDASAMAFLLVKLRKAKQKKETSKRNTEFIRYRKTDLKKLFIILYARGYPLGINFTYRGGKFYELKTKENFNFQS